MLDMLMNIGWYVLLLFCVFCLLAVTFNWLIVFRDSYEDLKHYFFTNK